MILIPNRSMVTHPVDSVVQLAIQFLHCDNHWFWCATLVSGKHGLERLNVLRQEVRQLELALCK